MTDDEVVREVRAAREAFAAGHGFDVRAIVTALHERGVSSGRELVRLTPRPVEPRELTKPSAAENVESIT
jgi:hypothetical protein